jgi:N-acetyl-anhydromuramyl-L-alanine amidase AmpD
MAFFKRPDAIEALESRMLLASAGPAAPAVTWIASPNFNSRSGTTVDSIVIHTTEGSYQSAVNRFLTPSEQVSAHYIVDTNGAITQMVDTANRAWHATYYNSRSIGIENVGFAGQASTWNAQNIPALEKLVAYLAYTYNVPVVHPGGNAYDYPNDQLNVAGIVAHGQVQPWNRTDPGPYFPWTTFIADVKKIIADATTPAQTPFGGTPIGVGSSPVTIQAENYDKGGEGVAYHDLDAANLGGGVFRTTEGVDVQKTTDAGGGFNVGYAKAAEWLEYTINVATAGKYTFDFRVASAGSNGKFHAAIDGANATGALSVPNTSGWQTWKTLTKTAVALPAGQHVLRIALDANGSSGSVGNFNYVTIRPDSAAPTSITIQAEDFDAGAEGVAYHDSDAANRGGKYRSTGVDIQTTTDTGGGFNVGYTRAGEWLDYTTTIATAGAYTLDFRVASAATGGTFHLEVDGVNLTGAINIANTGGWQTWTTVSRSNVNLAAGKHVLRLRMDANGSTGSVGNFNWLKLRPS